jgi:hypothetical protein
MMCSVMVKVLAAFTAVYKRRPEYASLSIIPSSRFQTGLLNIPYGIPKGIHQLCRCQQKKGDAAYGYIFSGVRLFVPSPLVFPMKDMTKEQKHFTVHTSWQDLSTKS